MRLCPALLRRLLANCRGSMAVEFAMLAPMFLMLIFGVLYAGMGLQSYNAVRNLSADVARYALVQKQSGNTLNNEQLQTYAIGRGQGSPYLLRVSQLNATVTTAPVQRVAGVNELRVQVTYQLDNLLGFAGIPAPFITYSRPIFLSNS